MTPQAAYEPLSRRELEILALLCEKLSDREIAERLYVVVPTVKWYNRQIFNKLGVNSRKQATQRAAELRLLDTQDGTQDKPPVPHNLPAQLTPFIGRSVEQAELGKLLTQPGTRLITVLAPGGMGKTRLALETAEGVIPRFADGVFFVALAPLTSVDQFIPAVTEALGLQVTPDSRAPQKQLEDYLRGKALLVVLDNFEHLLDAVPIVAGLLAAAPNVKILATSRERLNLQGETAYPLGGLQYPEGSDDDPLRYGAAQLFVESALRANPHFEAADPDAIGRLCRRVQGMPLAIELAAAWTGALSIAEIDAEVARTADFLETQMANVPERQRSVRAVFEAAWARLDGRAQQAFRRMSVFRGGCTREAAQEITGADARTLLGLVDMALLWRDPRTGRFDIHELLRQYAEGELGAAGEHEATLAAHQDYYARLTDEWCYWINYGKQREAYAVLDEDTENIRHAMLRAAERGLAHEVEPFTNLILYYDRRGWWNEGLAYCQYSSERLAQTDSVALAMLLIWQANIYIRFQAPARVRDLALRSVSMLQRLDAMKPLPFAMMVYAGGLTSTDDWQAAVDLIWEAIPIAEQFNPAVVTILFHLLGQATLFGERDHIKAEEYYREVLRRSIESGNDWGRCHVLTTLGLCAERAGDFDEAERRFTEALDLARTIDFHHLIQENLQLLSFCAVYRGDLAKARHLIKEQFQLLKSRGYPDHVVFAAVVNFAEIDVLSGDLGAVRHNLREAISLLNEDIAELTLMLFLVVSGAYFARTGDVARACPLFAHARQRMPGLVGVFLDSTTRLLDDCTNECRAALSPEAFEAAWTRGATLTNEEAIALAAEGLQD